LLLREGGTVPDTATGPTDDRGGGAIGFGADDGRIDGGGVGRIDGGGTGGADGRGRDDTGASGAGGGADGENELGLGGNKLEGPFSGSGARNGFSSAALAETPLVLDDGGDDGGTSAAGGGGTAAG
jgi:hypothetical protein